MEPIHKPTKRPASLVLVPKRNNATGPENPDPTSNSVRRRPCQIRLEMHRGLVIRAFVRGQKLKDVASTHGVLVADVEQLVREEIQGWLSQRKAA